MTLTCLRVVIECFFVVRTENFVHSKAPLIPILTPRSCALSYPPIRVPKLRSHPVGVILFARDLKLVDYYVTKVHQVIQPLLKNVMDIDVI